MITLTQEMAIRRYNQIVPGTIEYNLQLTVEKGESYQGMVKISFDLQSISDLLIDFKGMPSQVKVNGILQNLNYNQAFISIERTDLRQSNTIEIDFINAYSKDGHGLHSFIDLDGKQYLYTGCEPYYQNQVFPCFDQPDLKAYSTFTIIAPNDWIVVSNQNSSKEVLKQQTKWTFAKTLLLATYLYAFAAGPYYSIGYEGRISQTIYCRQNLKDNLNVLKDFIGEVTQKAIDFYENWFGVQFQFDKYDTIFSPEYYFYAMENPGCVTFDDSYISSTELDKEDYANFIILIVHEICHHWFGNYVTMKWWDDVWLNEAFAEYISHYCAKSIKISTPIQDIRLCLNQCKQRGYDEDQLASTHPIAGDVLNADLAKTIFDGITYNKGASVIQVLINLLGEKQFGNACRTYFEKYAWGNTKLVQFIECMQQESTVNLTQWTDLWIKKAGCNSVHCEWDHSRILITQKAVLSKYPLLREHRINIAIFYEDGSMEVKYIPLLDQLAVNLIKNNIVAVFPNYGDLAFIKIVLDPVSQKWFLQNFQKLDTLTRQMVFRIIYEQFNDGQLSGAEFITSIQLLDNEINTLLIQDFLDKIHQSLQYSAQKAELSGFVFNKILDLIAVEELTELIQYYSQKLYKFAIQKNHIEKLLDWIRGQDLIYIEYTASDIYNILDLGMAAQFIFSNAQLQQWLSYPSIKLDQYDLAKLTLRSKSYFINITQREQLWDDYCSPVPQLSLKNTVESMQAFNTHFRINDLIKYGDKFFQQIQYIYLTRSHVLAETFYLNLFPYYLPLTTLIQQLSQMLDVVPYEQPLHKTILESYYQILEKQKQQDKGTR